MALVRWEPVTMNRLFTNLFDTPTGAAPSASRWVPAMDLAETRGRGTCCAPTCRACRPTTWRSSSSIASSRSPASAGPRRRPRAPAGAGSSAASARSSGRCTLPEGIDGGAVAASFDNGVLTVTIPKPEERKPRRVSIAVEGAQPKAIEGSEAE